MRDYASFRQAQTCGDKPLSRNTHYKTYARNTNWNKDTRASTQGNTTLPEPLKQIKLPSPSSLGKIKAAMIMQLVATSEFQK